jgi:hypothetical protein
MLTIEAAIEGLGALWLPCLRLLGADLDYPLLQVETRVMHASSSRGVTMMSRWRCERNPACDGVFTTQVVGVGY